jgi:putative ABC transport system substrate-binding protein
MLRLATRSESGLVAVLSALVMLVTGMTAPAATAQDGRIARIGLLGLNEPECGNQAVRAGLHELGYAEGNNLVIECRHAGGRYEGLQPAADALARAKPDVIVVLTHINADAAQRATRQIPIVFIASSDPVFGGFAASLARPGGNMTGVTYYNGELNAKRLELLQAMAPGIRRVAVLSSPHMAPSVNEVYIRDITVAAKALRLEIRVVKAAGAGDLDHTFDEMAKWKADAVYILPTITFAYEAQQIADLAKWHRLPAMHWYKPFAAMGGLMAYGVDYPALQRRLAVYVDKILKGTSPGELPIEQPTQFELMINRETAGEFGLTIPQSILLRADKVIE